MVILKNVGLGDVAKAGVAGGLLASDGYITLPLIIGGVKTNVILQWVTGPTAGAETVNYPNVTFPVTFPNACL
ncbi:gp53-like domain-containing protein, partial [Enterobacter roggenkampii]|nr:phage tail protein [Enterobacter roggenkampii]